MDPKMKSLQRRAIIIAFLFFFMQQGKIFIQSALSVIAAAFPEQSTTTIQTLISGTALPLLIGSLVAGSLTVKWVTKKQLSLFALVLIFIGGCGPLLFQNNFSVIMGMRMVLGFGLGLMSPLKNAIVAEYTTGVTRSRIMGFGEATVSVCGVLLNLLGGYLAMISWQACFYMYLVAIPVFILALIFLPNKKPDDYVLPDAEPVKAAQGPAVEKGKEKFPLSAPILAVFLFGFLFMLFFNIYGLNIAMFILNQGLGEPMQAGVAGSALSVGGIVAGVLLGSLYKIFKNSLMGVGCLAIAVGYLIIAHSGSLTLAIIGSFLAGFGLNTCVAQGSFMCTQILPERFFALGIGIYVAAIHVAQFITPYVMNPIGVAISAGGTYNQFAAVFLAAGIATLIIGIVYVFLLPALTKPKKVATTSQS